MADSGAGTVVGVGSGSVADILIGSGVVEGCELAVEDSEAVGIVVAVGVVVGVGVGVGSGIDSGSGFSSTVSVSAPVELEI